MEIDELTLSKLTLWAEKSPKSVDDLKEIFEEKYDELKALKPDLAEDGLIKRARFLTYREVKSLRYVRAKPNVAVFIGFNQEYDVTRNDRLFAEEMFKRNPAQAVENGLTDAEGTVLDARLKMPWGADNPNYGNQLQPNYLRTSVGIGRPKDDGDMKLLVMTHNGDQAFVVPPLGKPVEFLANLRQDEELRRQYNSSVHTQFTETEISEFGEVDESGICDILADSPEEFKSDLANLAEWHAEHAGDNRRVVIVEADVIYVAPTPMSTGNYLMIIEDESTMDIEGEGVTVFVHPQIAHQLDFGAGSRVFVVGRSGMGPFYDRETRSPNPEIQVPLLNAFGIWAIPAFRIPPEETYTIESTEEVTA